MRILLTHFSYYRKNGWGRIFEEAKGLAALGHNVTLLCGDETIGCFYKSHIEQSVKIVSFTDIFPRKYGNTGYGFISILLKCIYVLVHKYEICHSDSHRPNAYIPCKVNRFFYRSKVYIEWWDDFGEKAIAKNNKKCFSILLKNHEVKTELSTKRTADGVIVLSSLLAEKANALGINKSRVCMIYGGCNTDKLSFNPSTDNYKEAMGIQSQFVTLGFIGNGDGEYDDLEPFLKALIETKYHLNVKFLNFGKPFDKTIQRMPELKDLIIECGWVDYYADSSSLSAVDVFVLIKKENIINNSGWPNKFGDYLAVGRPVLVNLYGEVKVFAKKWSPALIETKYDVVSITSSITDICSDKYNLRLMGETNRRIAENNSWLEKAKELDSFYTRVTDVVK